METALRGDAGILDSKALMLLVELNVTDFDKSHKVSKR